MAIKTALVPTAVPHPNNPHEWMAFYDDDRNPAGVQRVCGYGATPAEAIRNLTTPKDPAP